ncbi:type VI secretion system-associated protein VasI [Providencia stuartii]|uniref:type VI secretion system-associated protein VasI n=1 Tax=Providencia stuartii TaxID=588 RepID=UPI0014951BF3|nr:type VI secretion system-associated protein VasI [Providencia stuartii]NPD42956.1 type VI secretion system-associated protein TagO [Providencia stuartii]NPD96244.1 type VI secretion system-associated protein TagO [Providencia stuartii]HEM6841521.1 type VI secretion system-associated protein TagO [Providencia stuartii]
MNISPLTLWLMTSLFVVTTASAEKTNPQALAQALSECRLESSQLIRLACYDQIMADSPAQTPFDPSQMGKAWRQAMEHEMQREDNSAGFLVTLPEAGNYPVIMTIPAIGFAPPRPVMMISCIDNITRLQVALPRQQEAGSVMLTTDKTQFTADWFLRENGYVLESSRGIPGIDEIKRLLNGETLTLKLANNDRLTFNISGISTDIKPLRTACHW